MNRPMGHVIDAAAAAGAHVNLPARVTSNGRITDVRFGDFTSAVAAEQQNDNAVLQGRGPTSFAYGINGVLALRSLTFGRFAAAMNADTITYLGAGTPDSLLQCRTLLTLSSPSFEL